MDIVLGDPEQARRRFSLGPINGRLRFLATRSALGPGGFVGFVRLAGGSWDEIPRMRRVVIFAAGPSTTLLVSTLLAAAALFAPGALNHFRLLFQGAASMGLWQLACTAVPMRYPRSWGAYAGFPSDGRTVMTLLKEARAEDSGRGAKQ